MAAFDWLEKGLEDRSWLMTWLEVDPLFDPIRNDERFEEISRRVWRTGASDYPRRREMKYVP